MGFPSAEAEGEKGGRIFRGYLEVEPKVWAREESLGTLSRVDSLVLDIDGVIINVFSSFRAAISKTTQHYFSETLGWPGKAVLITPSQTELFKLSGGFNNDWELTFAAVLFYLAQAEKLSTQNLDELQKDKGALKSFTVRVQALGGGLSHAKTLIFQELTREQGERVERLWKRDLIQRVFQEYYGGPNYCQRLYGFEPTHFKGRGLLEGEKTIVDKELIRPFFPRVAVLTGRTREEAEVALERASLRELIPTEHILTDGALRKPDPETLSLLGKGMRTKVGVYLGDTPDDFQTVNNFRELKTSIKFFSGIILKKISHSKIFLEGKVDLLAKKTDDLLSALLKLRDAR